MGKRKARKWPTKPKESIDVPCSEMVRLIDEWVPNERNRAILKRRLVDGVTYERLSEEFSLSVRQVKNIVYRSEDRLFSHINI